VHDVQISDASAVNPVGLRLEFWRKSLGFIRQAPAFGHGTGTIPQLFRREATARTDPQAITTNPHNQVLVVALELGLLGTIVLLAMWIAHVRLFSRAPRRLLDHQTGKAQAAHGPATAEPDQSQPEMLAWFGLVIVIQNIVGSMFNSHLSDFSQGWLYVWGVGVLGGRMLRVSCVATRQ
jgi:O-antigen ligase